MNNVYRMPPKFKTNLRSLSQLDDARFLLPSYQRPYVWGQEQVTTLLTDMWKAYENSDDSYFIGTVLTSNKDSYFELIDGQQRFTTLWLIAVSFKALGYSSQLTGYLKVGNHLRLHFAIRQQVKKYLEALLESSHNMPDEYKEEALAADDYLKHISKAVTTIQGQLQSIECGQAGKTIQGFGSYIFQNVKFVMNVAPVGQNLNKLFTTMNNSGKQLEQSDILKSKLLKRININDRILYSKIWEACENMNNYFEKNVRELFAETEWINVTSKDFSQYNGHVFKFREAGRNTEGAETKISLQNILTRKDIVYEAPGSKKKRGHSVNLDEELVYCRSIISFSQLLLHTYRVFLAQKDLNDFAEPFHIKHLLAVFEDLLTKDENSIRNYFYLLWKTRYVFDKYVIKWVQPTGEKEEVLKIAGVTSTNKNDTRYFSRIYSTEADNCTMLQSVLYFTGNYNTQIWLSPYLKRLMDGENSEDCLESIDNTLSVSLDKDKLITYHLMTSAYVCTNKLDMVSYLSKPNGTSFNHYWFQKLEYVLWKEWPNKKNNEKYKQYRITSKNSIEHVFPQNEEYENELNDTSLHAFGNLALLSVSQNSSYSNMNVDKKKADFRVKPTYDSLKLAVIFDSLGELGEWNESTIADHQHEMIQKLKKHYINCSHAQPN